MNQNMMKEDFGFSFSDECLKFDDKMKKIVKDL